MKCTIPEISWHNRDPVLSVDIQPQRFGETFFRLASGGTDSHVLIWFLKTEKSGIASLECAADLTRHQKPVNVVRFSPSGDFLASGDDESCIIIWKQKTLFDVPEFPNDNAEEYKEQWIVHKVLRGHLQDVYDLSWSPDSKNLISGSVDNTAILWDITTGKNLGILTDHKGFVQGVSWDPCGQYVATMTSDRFLRIFSTVTKKVVSRVSKAKLPKSDPEAKPSHLFHDDTLKTFFRRLTFTPDGELIIVPSGVIEESGKNRINSTLIFSRRCLSKPIVYLPSMNQYSVAARCCPVVFELRPMADDKPLFDLPYRIVIAIATQRSVLLYDTQHASPIAFITNIHYTRLTDLTWSNDGKVLVISSTDGYCSIITFAEGELGIEYDRAKDNKLVLEKKTNEKVNIDGEPKKDRSDEEVNQERSTNIEIDDLSLTFEGKISPIKNVKHEIKLPTLKKKANLKSKEETINVEKIKEGNDVDEMEIEFNKQIENQDNVIDVKNCGEKKDIDEDFELVLEETTTQLKSVTEIEENKSEIVSKPILMLNLEHKKDAIEGGDNNESVLGLDKNDINTTGKVTKDSDKNKPISEVSPQKENKNKEDPSLISPKSSTSPSVGSVTPGQSQKKTPRRVQLITLSSPKSKKKLL